MKHKWATFVAIGLVMALILTLAWKGRSKLAGESNAPAAPETTGSPAIVDTSTVTPQSSRALVEPEGSYTKVAAAKKLLELYNHKPIEFFGLVLDQDNKPVSDVEVYGSIIYNTGAAGGTAHQQSKTDNRGRFYIGNVMGRTLSVGLAKEGYKYGGDQPQFHYTGFVSEKERHHPDREKPVVFRIWKLQGPEPLVDHYEVFRVPNDGKFIRIDLRSGKLVTDGGDVLVSLRYDQTKEEKFNWGADVVVPEGGILDAGVPYGAMFAAPSEEYKPTLEVRMEANSPSWRPDTRRTLYLKLSSDHYAKMSLNIGPHRLDTFGLATIQWSLNPKASSHILEPRPIEELRNR
jgi:hypothetical protein